MLGELRRQPKPSRKSIDTRSEKSKGPIAVLLFGDDSTELGIPCMKCYVRRLLRLYERRNEEGKLGDCRFKKTKYRCLQVGNLSVF